MFSNHDVLKTGAAAVAAIAADAGDVPPPGTAQAGFRRAPLDLAVPHPRVRHLRQHVKGGLQ